jgi:ubiquinone/menaquinone biosynthesis C-methylase UbiE
MGLERLTGLLKPNSTVERSGIYVAKEMSEKTVWDKLALENPTHAVISAKDENAAKEKSAEQIEDIKHFVKPGDILLDCGTGYGRVAQYLLPQMPLGGYIGADSAYDMLTLFKKRYDNTQSEQTTPLLLINSDIHTIPLVESSADVAIVCAVFLHNHKAVVGNAMEEIKRIIKPGGKVLVYSSFPRSATFMGIQGLAYQALLNLIGKPFKNGPVRYYRRREIMHMFDGFAEVELRPVGFNVLPKSIIVLPKILDKVWRLVIANPVNKILEKICPARLKPYFSVHYDVIATK